jgi:hypothetical protein
VLTARCAWNAGRTEQAVTLLRTALTSHLHSNPAQTLAREILAQAPGRAPETGNRQDQVFNCLVPSQLFPNRPIPYHASMSTQSMIEIPTRGGIRENSNSRFSNCLAVA